MRQPVGEVTVPLVAALGASLAAELPAGDWLDRAPGVAPLEAAVVALWVLGVTGLPAAVDAPPVGAHDVAGA
jgi:hypothetical protein